MSALKHPTTKSYPTEHGSSIRPYDYQQLTLSRNSTGSEDVSFLENFPIPLREQHSSLRRYLPYVAHGIIMIMNALILACVWHWRNSPLCLYSKYGPDLVYTPAKSAIEYESRAWDHTNIFFLNGTARPDRVFKGFGPPSAESDAAWADLIRYQNIRVSKEELGDWRDTPGLVELSDKSGYFVTLSAYHSLHCIKRVHHYLYFDLYYNGKTDQEKMLIEQHVEHCLNIFLQTVQCNPDLSLFPMQWGATTRIPIGLDEGKHQCTRWDSIDEWAKGRSFDVFKPGLIVHPTLGDAYPDGRGDDIGVALDHLLGDSLNHGGSN